MKKPPSWAVTRRRFFAVFALLGVGHPRWGDFEKPALKSPETRMNTEKNRGDIYFVTPSWCERRDLNPYVINTRPSNVPVCQFQHARISVSDNYYIIFGILCQSFSRVKLIFLTTF